MAVKPRMDFNQWNPFWATCFAVMDLLIVVGNSLTIATLLKRNFRKGPHFSLINLAVADLLVGCTIPLYIARAVMAPHNRKKLSFAWYQSVFTSVSAIFHLLVISLERLHAILRPFRHRQLSLKAYWVTIAVPWIFSLCLTISIFMLRKLTFFKRSDVVFFSIAFLTTPLLVTCCSYFAIWKKRRKSRDKVRSFRQRQEARFSRTIFLVIAASFLTCLPFRLCYIVRGLWPTTLVPWSVIFVKDLLRFSNSFVNFVVYFLRFPSYRKALFSSACPVKRRNTKLQQPPSVPSYGQPRAFRALES